MFDILQAVSWSITYLLVIWYGCREKTTAIPPIAVASNFAWETVALLRDFSEHLSLSNSGTVIHIAWFSLDLLIVLVYLLVCNPVYFSKWVFACIYVCEAVLMFVLFRSVKKGMLLSSFSIDILMAANWFFYELNKRPKTNFQLKCIAVSKLLGDLFAWLFYRRSHFLINIIGICVLILNAGFLFLVFIPDRKEKGKSVKKHPRQLRG